MEPTNPIFPPQEPVQTPSDGNAFATPAASVPLGQVARGAELPAATKDAAGTEAPNPAAQHVNTEVSTENVVHDVDTDEQAAKVEGEDVAKTAEDATGDAEAEVKKETPQAEDDAEKVYHSIVFALGNVEAQAKVAGSRELSIVRTKLEEAEMWAKKHLQKTQQ